MKKWLKSKRLKMVKSFNLQNLLEICRVYGFRIGPITMNLYRVGPKVGLWWGDGLFWGWKIHKIRWPYILGRRGHTLEDVNSQLLSHPRSLSLFSGFLPPPLFWEISVLIYPSPPFILLLHLLVIHAYTWVHVLSATLSSALWATVALIALFRSHIHINGVRELAEGI